MATHNLVPQSQHIAALVFDLHSSLSGNPAAVPERVKVLPDGSFASHDGRPSNMEGVTAQAWFLDAASAAGVLQWHAELGLDLVVDYDHQTLRAASNGQPAPAAGWITALQWVDGDGLWADVTWTDEARAILLAKKYRYLSPVFAFDKDSGQVLALLHIALTNTPGLATLPALTALSAWAAGPMRTGGHADSISSTPPVNKENSMDKTQVLAALSLPADTSDTTALAALSALPVTLARKEQEIAALKANQFDPAKHIPLDEHKKVSEQLAALSARQEADAHSQLMTAALASGTILPPNEAYWRKQPLAALQRCV